MKTISLCMIVKNEEELLGGCLESVHDMCDEIIILDTGSTDRTKEIANRYTDKIYDFKWLNDFTAARNASFERATKDYILWLNGDEIFEEKDRNKLINLKRTLDGTEDAISMLNFTDSGPSSRLTSIRLVKRENAFKWCGPVHEYIKVSGRIVESDIRVTERKRLLKSDPMLNLRIYEDRLKNGDEFAPRDFYHYANELKINEFYEESISYFQEFLDTGKGILEYEIRACLHIADCYRELGNVKKEKEALTASMQFDIPKPESFCKMGDAYLASRSMEQAIFWYELAFKTDIDHSRGYEQQAYRTWYPNLQLCVCYSILGNLERAAEYNAKAKLYLPNDPRVLNNEDYFAKQHQR